MKIFSKNEKDTLKVLPKVSFLCYNPSSVDKNIKKVYFLLKIGFSFELKHATIYLYRKYSDENVFRLF